MWSSRLMPSHISRRPNSRRDNRDSQSRRALLSQGSLCFGETVLSSTERLVDTNGVQLRVTEAGDRGAPVVILAHGFPELAYSWRHQIPALAAAGYHVLAPDMRGFGRSSAPAEVDAYDVMTLCADMCGLLDALGASDAVFVGHDCAGSVVWSLATIHPERVRAV